MTRLIAGSTLTISRFHELESDYMLSLTPEEVAEGWHFCDDWDGLLVHPTMIEAESCYCFRE